MDFLNNLDINTLKVIMIIVIVALIILVVVAIIKDILNRRPHPMDELEGLEFEYYCADLLKNNGFIDVEVTKASGDFGADILAEKDGITYAFQCKCYDKPIGVHAIEEIYAGRDFYDRMVGVVMTNQYFTDPAVKMAEKFNILLWDRGYIDEMEKD